MRVKETASKSKNKKAGYNNRIGKREIKKEELMALIEPGLYHVNMRGATIGECWRLGKTFRGFLFALYYKLIGGKMSYAWFPPSDIRKDCFFEELGPVTKGKLTPLIEQARKYGFKERRFRTATKMFNKNVKEAGSYMALHENRNQILSITYVLNINELLPERIIERTSINVVSVTDEMKYIGAHNNDFAVESGGVSRCVYIPNSKLEDIVRKCNKELQRTKSPVITFRDLGHYDEVFDKIEKKIFLFHINRGYYQKADSRTQESVLKEFGYV
jgi:hypothetical protein